MSSCGLLKFSPSRWSNLPGEEGKGTEMRILIACDNEATGQRVREILSQNAMECPAGHVVSLELAPDRASRLVPELVVFVLPPNRTLGLDVLRETCQTVHGARVLVVGPAADAKLILATLRQGADEYLDEAMLISELNAAMIRLKAKRASPAELAQSGKIIAVLGPSGGCGSSTLAVSISTVLADQCGTCGLVDLRLSAGDMASMLDLKPQHTIADLSDRLDRVDQGMFDQFFVQHESGVHLLAAPYEYAQVSRITDKVVRRALTMARVRFPYVVVELDNAFSSEQIEAIWQADEILLILRLDYTSIRNTRRAMDNLHELGIESDRVRLLANNYRQRKQLRVGQAEKALGAPIQYFVPHDPARVNGAINRGVPIVLHRPAARVSKSIVEVAASLNGHYGPQETS